MCCARDDPTGKEVVALAERESQDVESILVIVIIMLNAISPRSWCTSGGGVLILHSIFCGAFFLMFMSAAAAAVGGLRLMSASARHEPPKSYTSGRADRVSGSR